jgi:arsenate reductase-like glutaredoxin family protein
MSVLLAELYEEHAVGCVEAAARTDDPKHREMLLKLAQEWMREAATLRVAKQSKRRWTFKTFPATKGRCRDQRISEFVMQHPNLIKFPLKITEDRDLEGHARVADANNAFVFRLVAGDVEMLNALLRELNIRATKLN